MPPSLQGEMCEFDLLRSRCVSVGVVILKRIAATPANPHAGLVTMESVLHQIFADVIKAMKDITKLVLHR
jgi:hypothetical protein